jgi:hypothetical protein
VTAQASESLLYQGETLSMCTDVLNFYFVMADMEAPFVAPHSALWRGYVGTWEIKDDRLYLIDLRGELKNGQNGSVDDIFPGSTDRVFAHWFTGRLRAPQGKMLQYIHMGFNSTYEFDLLIEIDRGVVTRTKLKSNGMSDDGDTLEGDRVGGWTNFGRK